MLRSIQTLDRNARQAKQAMVAKEHIPARVKSVDLERSTPSVSVAIEILRSSTRWRPSAAGRRCRAGTSSTIHDRFLEWRAAGVFERLWRAGLLTDAMAHKLALTDQAQELQRGATPTHPALPASLNAPASAGTNSQS
jgi:hypothetical protein